MGQRAPWFATLRGSQGGNVNHACHKTNFRIKLSTVLSFNEFLSMLTVTNTDTSQELI